VLAGVTDPSVLSWLGTIPTVLFSTLGVFLVYRLALAWRWPSKTALAAAFLYAVHWLPFGYGATLFPRPISTAFLLGAFLLASRAPVSAARAAAAGALVAAAFAVRWSEGAALVPLLAWIWWRDRDARTTAAVAGGFVLGALLFVGVTDALTWGAPFSSLKEYVREMSSATFFASTDRPWYEYARQILRWAGPLYLLLLWPGRRDPRIRAPLLFLAAIVAAFSCIRFKQTRYMQAAIPFLALAAAVGWERLRASGTVGRRLAAASLLLAAALGLERAVALLSDKSQSATAAARAIARLSPAPRSVALEQAWAYGDRLLIGNGREIRDFPPARPLDPVAVTKAAGPADVLALYTLDTSPPLLDAIARMGFRESARFHRDSSKEVILYLREQPRASDTR
jgi:glycosyl transferase family 22 (putative mannosyltransferase)